MYASASNCRISPDPSLSWRSALVKASHSVGEYITMMVPMIASLCDSPRPSLVLAG
ncbi:Uncharacterised protein [Mycobacteroides abscessus subsp. abscessus]|nr:Uncharacterised protein [Mycobacteroides abscessus subsp. abscessus]SKU47305.1 Uncharacterised protein [Mycobacteroides abscessus subsp. abscessus]